MSVKKNNDNDKDSKSVAMNMNKEYHDITENENNQKMNFIYTTNLSEQLKHNCDELEKLEQEYLKRINETKPAK